MRRIAGPPFCATLVAMLQPDCGTDSDLAGTGPGEPRRIPIYPWLLAGVVLLSRILAAGPIYFADGPSHVEAVQARTYVIQPPGYWLFNRTAALFPDPERGIVLLNWVFSVLGVVVFYYAARLLVRKGTAQLGAAVYAAVFYGWFSGDIHSTYASQLLFPVLVFLLLMLHNQRPRLTYLLAASVAYALGAGFRPTDGFFVGFMFLYYVVRHAPWRQALLAVAVVTVLCLVWLVPTLEAFTARDSLHWALGYSAETTRQVSPLFQGITFRSAANVARFAVPFVAAFWPLLLPFLKTALDTREGQVRLLWLWITPGMAYLVLFYMSDAPYLNFMTAAVLLLALKQLDSSKPLLRTLLLTSCLVTNVAVFLLFSPVPSKSLAANVLNVFVGKYTRFAIRNRWQPNLSDVIDRDTLAPKR